MITNWQQLDVWLEYNIFVSSPHINMRSSFSGRIRLCQLVNVVETGVQFPLIARLFALCTYSL